MAEGVRSGAGLADLRVRAGVAGDLEAMYKLDVACFEPPFRFSRAAMRRFTLADGAFSLVVETGDQVMVGFIVVQMESSHVVGEGYVVTLDVAEEFRRRGVAGALLEAAEKEVVARGARFMSLHVWTENGPAIRFYENGGYERMQLHPSFYDAERDAYGYRKELLSYRAAVSQSA